MYGWLAEDWSTYLVHEASIPLKPGDRGWRLLASLDPASLPAISAAAGLEAEWLAFIYAHIQKGMRAT